MSHAKLLEDIILHAPTVASAKPLAIFDFDGTLVKPKDGRQFPRNVSDWQYLRPSVPSTLSSYAATHTLVIVTDQSKSWKVDMIHAVLADLALPELPTVVIGVKTQKPSTAHFTSAFPSFLLAGSFYVGDAAGRPGDWSDRDKAFAQALSLPFKVPEEVFPMQAPAPAAHTPQNTSQPLTVQPAAHREVVIMCGYPASGKSTLASRVFEPAGYHITSGDVHKTAAKMKKDALLNGVQAGKSVVFDSTAGTVEKRAEFIAFAAANSLPARIVWCQTPIEIAMEYNKERALGGGANVPAIAFYTFRKHFVAPSEAEGAAVVLLPAVC
jgi:bifunctional polynucleotide phosphatase/kinase